MNLSVSEVIHGECLEELRKNLSMYRAKVSMIYIDPPFMTNKVQKIHNNKYEDKFSSLQDYLAFIKTRVLAGKEYLTENGSFLSI